MATFTVKPLARGAVPTSQATAYTTPALTTTIIRSISFTNTTGGNLTVSVWVVPSGGTAGSSNLYFSAALLIPGLPPDADERVLVLAAGDFIVWQASGAGVNGYLSGAEET